MKVPVPKSHQKYAIQSRPDEKRRDKTFSPKIPICVAEGFGTGGRLKAGQG
jgi:hypothetical protein